MVSLQFTVQTVNALLFHDFKVPVTTNLEPEANANLLILFCSMRRPSSGLTST